MILAENYGTDFTSISSDIQTEMSEAIADEV